MILRSFVYVTGGTFNSASFEEVFGAVLVGENSLLSDASAFEMLLHEGGHHLLFLRTAWDDMVRNPDELASHPLREDPRPISGTLHAAYVMARVVSGLKKWLDVGGGPQCLERYEHNLSRLGTTLDILRDKAEWTPTGSALFRQLSSVHGEHASLSTLQRAD